MSFEIERDSDWTYLAQFLPTEAQLEESAHDWGAMKRRRKVRSATDLLRLCLVWAGCHFSLMRTAAWAKQQLGVELTDAALTLRFANCADWLSSVVFDKLAERVRPPDAETIGERRVRLIDTSALAAPGAKGTSWQLHLDFDLVRRQLTYLEVTDASQPEDIRRFHLAANDLVIADRRYSQRHQLDHLIGHRTDFIVRLNWRNVPLEGRQGEDFDLFETLRRLPEAQAQSLPVRIKAHPKRKLAAHDVWLVALKKSPEAAEHDRQRLIKQRKAKGGRQKKKKIDPRTLEAAGYILVLTTLSAEQVNAEAVLEMYRFRWQIELEIKRLKSLHRLKELPAKTAPLARTWLLAQMYLALLTEEIADAPSAFSPWGYPLRRGAHHQPVACH